MRDVATAACSLTLLAYPFDQAPLVEWLPPSSAGVTRIKRYDFEDDLINP